MLASTALFYDAPIDDPGATTVEAVADAAELAGLHATLRMLAGDDPDELRSCKDLLVRTFGETLDGLDAAVVADDRPQLRFHAHSLKGSALSAGLDRVGDLAQALEHAARTADAPTLAAAVARLRAHLGRVLHDLGTAATRSA